MKLILNEKDVNKLISLEDILFSQEYTEKPDYPDIDIYLIDDDGNEKDHYKYSIVKVFDNMYVYTTISIIDQNTLEAC